MAAHFDHFVAGLLYRLRERAAGKVVEVHLHIPGPVPAEETRDGRIDVHRRDGDQATGANQALQTPELAGRVCEMLDDVPERDEIVALRLRRQVVHGPTDHVEAARLGVLGGPAGRLDALRLPTLPGRDLDKHANVGPDVEQAAGRGEAR